MNKPIPERVEEILNDPWLQPIYDSFISKEDKRTALKTMLTKELTETDQQARASELELLAVHLDRQLAGYTNVSVDSVYRYIEQRKETLSNPPSQV